MISSFGENCLLKNKYCFLVGIFLFVVFLVVADGFTQENSPANISIEGRNWELYSSGVRTRMFLDVYQCAIYLDQEEKNLDSDLDLKHPIAIRIQILISELPEQVPDPWRESIKPEISDQLYSRFKKEIFKLTQRDLLIFTFLPGGPTKFYINNEKKFSDPGSGLMHSLLEQWIGPFPVSEDLKTALLLKKGKKQ